MKLSPQPAVDLLPLSSKVAPTALLDKGAFAATIQGLMGSPSGPAVAAVIQTPAGGLPQIAVRTRPVTPPPATHTSAGEESSGIDNVPLQTLIVARSSAAAAVPRDEMRRPLAPQPSIQVSSPIEEIPELPISMSQVKNPAEEPVFPQSPYVPRELGPPANTHTPSSEMHKTGAVAPDPTNPPTARSPEIPPVAMTTTQYPISVPVPEPTFSERNVQPATHSLDMAGGRRRRTSMSRPVITVPAATSNSRIEIPQVAKEEPQLKIFATAMKSTPPRPGRETTIPDTVPRSNQNLPGRAAHSKEDHETIAWQMDARASQEAGKTSSTVAKPGLTAEPSIHPTLDLSPTPRPPSANIPNPPPAMHRPEVLTEAPRAQPSAAQVLQRMDTPPLDGTVLRADARHLDVGVSSGILGWVEVRATASSSGRVDAAVHVQTNSSAHILTAQSKEIATYAREHSVELGQLSVGVGTGDSGRGHSRSHTEDTEPVKRAIKTAVSNDLQRPAEKVSFISVRA